MESKVRQGPLEMDRVLALWLPRLWAKTLAGCDTRVFLHNQPAIISTRRSRYVGRRNRTDTLGFQWTRVPDLVLNLGDQRPLPTPLHRRWSDPMESAIQGLAILLLHLDFLFGGPWMEP